MKSSFHKPLASNVQYSRTSGRAISLFAAHSMFPVLCQSNVAVAGVELIVASKQKGEPRLIAIIQKN